MENIKFNNSDTIYEVDFSRINSRIQIIFSSDTLPTDLDTSYFELSTSSGKVYAKFEGYSYIYRTLENGYILSNTDEVYVETSTETVDEISISLDDYKELKVAQMNSECTNVIYNGIDVTLTDETVEHFSLDANDQINLIGLQTAVLAGQELIAWHTNSETEHCKYYSNADMKLITTSALSFVMYNVTYFRDLRIYINSLSDVDSVNAIEYGVTIPEEYQSGVLKDMLSVS